jgi:hypothetical protein
MLRTPLRVLLPCTVSVGMVLFGASDADALPSFARQTGMACAVCHSTFPELTSFGRQFKVNGYTMTGLKQIESSGERSAPLRINEVFPLSVMLQTSFTRTDERQPGTQNNDVEFPQQLSIFLAGEITSHIGAFLQATYTGQDDHITMDNTDIRYANQAQIGGKDTVYGVTLNNNPTVEDLWNSTPAWGYPWASPDSTPMPAAGALIDGALAQEVAGAGAYALWNQQWYADVSVYRSAHIGGPQPPTDASGDNIENVAPYWRLAWQHSWEDNYLEVGTSGLFAELSQDGVLGATDRYTDLAFDAQYERPVGSNSLSAHALYIYEDQNLDATHAAGNSANPSDNLHTFRLNGIYRLGNRVSLALGYFLIRGDSDKGLYAPAPINGSTNGSPDSDGVIAEVGYFPWQNVRLSVQYTAYMQFNGRTHNYDGIGRDAADNNPLYLLAWLVW